MMKDFKHYIDLLEIHKFNQSDLLDIFSMIKHLSAQIEYLNLKITNLHHSVREAQNEATNKLSKMREEMRRQGYRQFVIKNYEDYNEYLLLMGDEK